MIAGVAFSGSASVAKVKELANELKLLPYAGCDWRLWNMLYSITGDLLVITDEQTRFCSLDAAFAALRCLQ